MRLKNTIKFSFLAIATCGIFLALRPSEPSTATPKSNSCQESMEDCCKNDEKGGKTNWDNLSHQFFSSF